LGLLFKEKYVKERLLWLNWQSLYRVLVELPLEHNSVFIALPEPFQRMVKVMRNDVCGLLKKEGLIPISFDAVDTLMALSVMSELVPVWTAITSIIQYLDQLAIFQEVIPRWQGHPDLLNTLGPMKLKPEYIPDSPLASRFQE
jgi:hypothetical protein